MNERIQIGRVLSSTLACMLLTVLPASAARADVGRQHHGDENSQGQVSDTKADIGSEGHGDENSESQIKRGFAIAPVPLNLAHKNRALVGLGSYIVNTTGCSDCHTNPAYRPGHNPFLGQPEQINAAQYLAGGRQFPPSPFVSANITPDATGKPAGLTFDQFRTTIRTGHNPLDPPGIPLQIMPWPVFGKMTDRDLRAIYEYLGAIPSLPDNPHPSPTP